jgi:hypothetical protein
MNTVLQICLSIAAMCVACFFFVSSVYLAYRIRDMADEKTDEDDDDGGNEEPNYRSPYGIDPDNDPSDWWKHI